MFCVGFCGLRTSLLGPGLRPTLYLACRTMASPEGPGCRPARRTHAGGSLVEFPTRSFLQRVGQAEGSQQRSGGSPGIHQSLGRPVGGVSLPGGRFHGTDRRSWSQSQCSLLPRFPFAFQRRQCIVHLLPCVWSPARWRPLQGVLQGHSPLPRRRRGESRHGVAPPCVHPGRALWPWSVLNAFRSRLFLLPFWAPAGIMVGGEHLWGYWDREKGQVWV